ncbi:hypothetical protein AB836_00080 [Rickettsiales bacterium (ex Bugula neritina AB1)]|nr:hypothetical protein AB836_00080 [Rickettsiales bacterium (ex Bugula neritina AB1)]
MLLQNLKKKIDKIKSIYKMSKSLKNISITRIRSLYKNYDIIKNHINEIKEVFLDNIKEVPNNEYKNIHIFIFSDMGFVGSFNKNIKNILYEYIEKNKDIIYVLGNKSLEIIKSYDNIKFLGKLQNNSEIFKEIFIDKYVNIIVHIPYKEAMVINSLDFKKYNSENIYINNCWMYYNLEKCLLKAQIMDTRQRMDVTIRSLKNSEELWEKLQLTYNSIRQENITNDIINRNIKDKG